MVVDPALQRAQTDKSVKALDFTEDPHIDLKGGLSEGSKADQVASLQSQEAKQEVTDKAESVKD